MWSAAGQPGDWTLHRNVFLFHTNYRTGQYLKWLTVYETAMIRDETDLRVITKTLVSLGMAFLQVRSKTLLLLHKLKPIYPWENA